jgi:hypothetical protein
LREQGTVLPQGSLNLATNLAPEFLVELHEFCSAMVAGNFTTLSGPTSHTPSRKCSHIGFSGYEAEPLLAR